MFSFTRKVDYALIALVSLARGADDNADAAPQSARQIAERYNMPAPMVMKLLKMLNKAGVVRARRGARGGYELAGDPAALRIRDIIQAVDGPIRMAPCCEDLGIEASPGDDGANTEKACRISPDCPIMKPIQRLNERVLGLLEQLTLADLLGDMTEVTASRGAASDASPTGR